MSSPWAWFGNEFPSVQGVLDVSLTGDGTDYQILWDMTDGATTDNEICKFEWTTKTITLTISGTVNLPFLVPSTGATEMHSTPFSKVLALNVNSPATTTWDGNEVPNGSDYPAFSSCSVFSGSNSLLIPVTLSDGTTSSFGFNFAVFMGSVSSAGLYGIAESLSGRVYSRYTKEVIIFIPISSNIATSITFALNKTSLTGTLNALGPQTVFHTTANAYWTAPNADGSTFSLSGFSLAVSAVTTTPPNI